MLQKSGHELAQSTDIFSTCHDIIIKTLLAVEPKIVAEMNKLGKRQRCCFEIYGFDVIYDEDMHPWVLEVNCLPSLSSSSVFDKQVKTQLICDAFTLIGIRGYDKLSLKTEENPEFEEPKFTQTFAIEKLEELGGCCKYQAEDASSAR